MKSYVEFCRHYELDVDAPEARRQYQDYRRNAEIMLAAVRSQDEARSSRQTQSGHPAS